MDEIKGLSRMMQEAESRGSFEGFDKVGTALVQAKSRVREAFQALTAPDVEAVIQKLKDNQPLTPQEQECVRWWVVGDAEAYTRLENSFKDWVTDFKRLAGVLGEFEGQGKSPQVLINLHGLLEDACRLAADIAHFLDYQGRIARFDKAIGSLSKEESQLIANFLKSKLSSEEM